MIDSTIYTNGRGEVTAQNVNLAMHGMVDATEEKITEVEENVRQTDVQIVEIKNDISKLGESGLGGITFKFPMAVLELLEPETPEDALITQDTIAEIAAEFPTLLQPLNELIEHNAKMLAKVQDTINEGKSLPIITVDVTALYDEFLSAIGETLYFTVSANLTPTLSYYMSEEALVTNVCMESGINVTLGFTPEACEIVSEIGGASIYIPHPTDDPIDNSAVVWALENSFPNMSYYNANDYYYNAADASTSKRQAISPVLIKKSEYGKNLLMHFVVDAEVIEAIINLETGITKSRVIATMTPQEVGVIPEGSLSRIHNLTYPYYDPLPAAGEAVVSIGVESSVSWILYDHETMLTYGNEGKKTYEYVVGPNESTETFNHNYRLVAAEDGEELATMWIAQKGVESLEPVEES